MCRKYTFADIWEYRTCPGRRRLAGCLPRDVRFMGKWIGMAGIIFASAVSKLLTYIWYEPIILFRDHFKKSVWGYFVSFFATLVISCGAGFGVKLLADMIPLSGILGFIVKGIVCFAATNILYLILYFKNPYFKELLVRVKSLVGGVIGKFKKAK